MPTESSENQLLELHYRQSSNDAYEVSLLGFIDHAKHLKDPGTDILCYGGPQCVGKSFRFASNAFQIAIIRSNPIQNLGRALQSYGQSLLNPRFPIQARTPFVGGRGNEKRFASTDFGLII
ncbi:hypothetical protein [Brucella sp. NBRC 13694]|uniref:hypothetical protein n=1 Tax=Brucella sp. NBRC 13694 TaxID=3075482 RepID=UPI00333F3FAD